jgi:hypothetical protein
MGSAGYIVKDALDEIELVESSISGQGFKIFGEFEKRLEQKISKLVLGHADAIDSTPGKLGGGQGEISPAQMALDEITQIDSKFVESFVNDTLFPKLRNLGFSIPENQKFAFLNNVEKELARVNEDKNNKVTADIALTMKNAGLEMDAAYFSDRTGIPAVKAAQIETISAVNKIKNKLEKLYS